MRQHVCIGFSECEMEKVGGGWWGDSWQCELWLNCRRECTERLETVGVKKLKPLLQSVIRSRQWSRFQTFLYTLPIIFSLLLFFCSTSLVLIIIGARWMKTRRLSQTADETHIVSGKGLELVKKEMLLNLQGTQWDVALALLRFLWQSGWRVSSIRLPATWVHIDFQSRELAHGVMREVCIIHTLPGLETACDLNTLRWILK